MFKEDTKDIIGKILFLISIGILIYMFFSPLSQIIIHADEYFTIGTIRLSFLDSMAITANYIGFMHFVGDLLVSVLLNVAIASVSAFVLGKINALLEKKQDNIYW